MMNKNLILVGGGGHCKSVIDVAESAGYNILGILDMPEDVGKLVLNYKVIGTDDDIPLYVDKAEFVITVGFIKNPATRIKLYNKVKEAGGKLATVIASTEAGSLFAAKGDSFQIPEKIRDKFTVVDDELLIHRSLLGKSDSFKFDGDYYHSGDLIEWVNKEEGIFKFKSRKNELINVGGYKVNPGEVEDAINAMDGVKQSLVYGKANSILGNVLVAEVQLEEGFTLTDLDIRKSLKERLQDFKIPRKIKFVETFSLTRTGKLKRS